MSANLTPAEKSMAVALSKAATSSGYGLLGGPLRRVLAKAAVSHAAATEPDWADVREAARNAGWVRTGNRIISAWTVKGPDGEDDDRHGWAAVYPHHRKIHLTGPGEGTRFNRSFADLVDPSPAQMLEVARGLGLVGLGGEPDA